MRGEVTAGQAVLVRAVLMGLPSAADLVTGALHRHFAVRLRFGRLTGWANLSWRRGPPGPDA